MSKSLVPARPDAILAALTDFNLRPNDTFKISASKGVISITKRKANGQVESIRVRANGSFQQATKFDPSTLTLEERRSLELEMYKSGTKQAEIAELLGVSQATVSLDLRKVKKKK